MKNMKKLILVCGPAGIGKSTWCEAYKTEHPSEDVNILAADEVRKSMYGGYDKFPPDHNMMHVYLQMIAIATDLYNTHPNLTLILDTTMLYDERRLFFVRHLPKFDERILVLLKASRL
jgi:GTPase SAR1 family protein